MNRLALFSLFIFVCFSCKKDRPSETLFVKVDMDDHGIDFQNTIEESDSLNVITLEYIYNGGGVGVADFNNDGLSDVFLLGNTVDNKLYINKGNLKFTDVTAQSGVAGTGKWKSSVAVADVNADGLKDIYVCATILKDTLRRQNMLFINKGFDSDGVPKFEDQAAAFGVNYAGHSSGAAFFDYDNDNDLDLYVMTNSIVSEIPISYREKINDGSFNADVLYRNNGNGTFTDVSREAGIVHEGYGLGIGVSDINMDGWMDIYISNDYITNDLLYINNGDGTFSNQIDERIKHQSQFSMGNDIADFNNDGYPDIITLDMLPEGNLRRKTVISGNSYSSYINNKKYGYGYQYVRNMLQVNNGDGTFSEVGQLAGVHQTEWSWSPLFVDVDNDGFKDLFITNGFPRDVTDKDFANFRAETKNIASIRYQIDSIPVVKVPNYAFKNNGDLTFTNKTSDWGMSEPSFSNGASFADFDNDGDLDYIVNNINQEIFLYENRLYNESESNEKHYVRIKLIGAEKNMQGIGAKIRVYYDGKFQYHNHSVARGYISSVEEVIHFGLDTARTIDSITCEWPDGKRNTISKVKVDQTIQITYKDAVNAEKPLTTSDTPLLKNVTAKSGVKHVHNEIDKIDFNIQRTIPHKYSQSGPGLAVGDVNGDNLDDFFVGGSADFDGTLFLQNSSGIFVEKKFIKSSSKKEEDQGAVFFDADGDDDLDLFVVSGSFEYEPDSDYQQDRLYINNGKGNFTPDPSRVPDTKVSGSCVRAADVDGDGDLDLFVGGKVIPGQYPYPAESFLLINEKGKFTNKTQQWSKDLSFPGIINDALFSDFDADGKVDLILAGELMPITFFRNTGSAFEKLPHSGIESYFGWWNSIAGADLDQDGDTDYVTGNLGLNNYYKASAETPLRVYAKDFDGNSSVDAILSCYLRAEDGSMQEFPVHFWDELNSQSPKFRRKFRYYKRYGCTTMDKLLTPEEKDGMDVFTTNYTSTSFVENLGNGKFAIRALPLDAQVAPVNGISIDDVNDDGFSDIILVGNDFGNEIFTGKHDAFTGLVLLNDGAARFTNLPMQKRGFKVDGDAKALAKIMTDNGTYYATTQNRDSVKVFSKAQNANNFFSPTHDDIYADIVFDNGKTERVEFYFGSGYLSQSTRKTAIKKGTKLITIYNVKGKSRTINMGAVTAR